MHWARTSQDFKEGDLRSVRIGQSPGRTRVVFNLDKSLRYNATVDGQNVVITLQPSVLPRRRQLNRRILPMRSRASSHIL